MKKIMRMSFFVLLLVSLFAGCTVKAEKKSEDKTQTYYFYEISQDETKLEKEVYEPSETTAEYMIKDMMQRLNDKQAGKDSVSLLPDEVQMMNYQIKDTTLVVNFNSAYNDMGKAREILVRAGTVKTFLQVPGIEAVSFTVEGEELLDSKGQPIGEMAKDTFAGFSGNESDVYCYETFTLYFTDKEGKQLVEETRTVRYKRNIPKERIILEQLMKGPLEKGHYPTIPEDTQVLNVTVADRICYVSFDSVFSAYALDISEKIPIYSVVNSLLANIDADKVQIMVGGDEKQEIFGEDTSLYQFYEKNDDLVVTG